MTTAAPICSGAGRLSSTLASSAKGTRRCWIAPSICSMDWSKKIDPGQDLVQQKAPVRLQMPIQRLAQVRNPGALAGHWQSVPLRQSCARLLASARFLSLSLCVLLSITEGTWPYSDVRTGHTCILCLSIEIAAYAGGPGPGVRPWSYRSMHRHRSARHLYPVAPARCAQHRVALSWRASGQGARLVPAEEAPTE